MIKRLLPIDGYPNYKISSLGCVYSLKTKRFLKPFISNSGYEVVTLCCNLRYIKKSIHRLVAKTFLIPKHGKKIVNHIDGNKLNNRVDNLEWNSYSENNLHSYRIGTNIPQRGEKHFAAKLSNAQVIEIKNLLSQGLTYNQIAPRYSVSTACIGSIKRGVRRLHD